MLTTKLTGCRPIASTSILFKGSTFAQRGNISMIIPKLGVSAVLMLALSGCASHSDNGSSLPIWLTQTPTQPGHVYGTGSAPIYTDQIEAIHRASDQARAAMIQKLRVTMTSEISQQTYSKRENGQETEVTQQVNQQVRSRIPQVELDDIEIQQTHVDSQGKTAYALAHLDRQKAAAKIRRAMTNIEFELEGLKSVDTTGDRLQALQTLMPALGKFHQLDQLAERLQLVSPTGRNASLDPSLQTLKADIYALLDALLIQVKPTGVMDTRLQQRLVAQLNQKGFRITTTSEADLTIKYDAQFRQVEKSGTYYVFADGTVSVSDAAGKTLSTQTTNIKGASSYAELAENYAVKDLADQMGRKVAEALIMGLQI
jgi:hypothetical protein